MALGFIKRVFSFGKKQVEETPPPAVPATSPLQGEEKARCAHDLQFQAGSSTSISPISPLTRNKSRGSSASSLEQTR